MSDQADLQALTLAVGEMRGQMRELIHSQNNMAQKVDGLTERVLLSQGLPAEIGKLSDAIAKLSDRIEQLETERDRRDGATGVLSAILKSPAAGWLVGITVAAIAIIKGEFIR